MDDISNSNWKASTNGYRSSNHNSTKSYDPSYSDVAESSHSPPIKSRGCSKFNSQFSLSKMNKLISKLTKEQIDIVSKCGFRSLLCLKCSAIPNGLVIWLARHYDPKSRSVKAPGGTIFKMDAPTAHQILGIPFTGNKVPSKSSRVAKDVVIKDTNQSNQGSKIDDLLDMVNPDLVGDRFARIFFLIVLGIFLCPSSNTRVSHHYYEAICKVPAINKYDWCSEVVECLHMGIIKFHTNMSKANTSGTATLPGCVFLLVAAYYDYLVVSQNIVDQAIPQIRVWDDKALTSYRQAEIKIEHIEFKSIEATLFTSNHINPKTYRGFSALDLRDDPLQAAGQPCTGTCNEQDEAPTNDRTPPSKAANIDSPYSNTINLESARKVMPGASQMSLRVLCGEATHPDVDLFIKSTIGTAATTEAHERIHIMCQTFFKDSVQQYIRSIEPLLVSQCCDMVRSFQSGLQQAKSDNVPTGDSPATHPTQPGSENFTHTMRSSRSDAQHFSAGGSPPNNPPTHDMPHAKSVLCSGCSSEIPESSQHICTALVLTMQHNTSPKTGAPFPPNDVSLNSYKETITGTMSSTPSASNTNSPVLNCSHSEGEKDEHTVLSHGTPGVDMQSARSVGVPLSQVDNISLQPNRTPSSKTLPPHVQHDPIIASSSHCHPKRNLSFQDEVVTHPSQSPQKKMKSLPISPSGSKTPIDDVIGISSDPSNADAHAVSKSTYNTTAADKRSSKKILSDLGHRKRALKEPVSLLQGEKMRPSKVVISELDKEIYHLCTKRIKHTSPSPDCVRIGRMSISMKEFAETMRAKQWVGTFAMNVYSEALTYDQSLIAKPKIVKGFLTSAEVDHMKVNGISVDLLKRKLRLSCIGFDMDKVDMVMIPVLHGIHWWLIVANIRDKRFDVLSSLPFSDETREVSEVVITNFKMVFNAMYGPHTDIILEEFRTAYQGSPQQNTNVDCGIFVMNFMSLWDGRRVPPIDNAQIYNYRVQAAVYLIRHKANVAMPATVKKLIQKHEAQSLKKKNAKFK